VPGNRRSVRLKDYDYSQGGMYYVTICANDKRCVFGDVKDGKMILNDAGRIIAKNWKSIPERFPNVEIDEYIVMPTHLHGIITIVGAPLVGALNNRAGTRPAPTLREIYSYS